MAECNQIEKSIGEQVAELVQRIPKNFDVIFSVGPQKTKVEAVKILLKAASPVFETEFDQNWESAVVKEGEGIPLPEFDPIVFKLFVNLKFDISVSKRDLFTAEEKVAVFEFIGANEDEKAKYDKTQLPFKTKPRNLFGCSVLRLPKEFKITDNPPFACNGALTHASFQVNKKISLHGVGFLGPIDGDVHYDVTVQIKSWGSSSVPFDSGTFKRKIPARNGSIFYFLLDEPIKIEPSVFDSKWTINHYSLHFSIKGAKNMPQYKAETSKDEVVQMSGVKFNLYSGQWNSGCPVAELLYKITE